MPKDIARLTAECSVLRGDLGERSIRLTGSSVRSGYLLVSALTMALSLSAGVGCDKQPKPDESRTLTKDGSKAPKRSTALQLYDAIVAETRARGWPIETASEKYYLVNTAHESLNERFRKRRIMRVVILPRGGALRVKVEHERNVGSQEQPQWVVVEDAITAAREDKEELELARAIERRFHASR